MFPIKPEHETYLGDRLERESKSINKRERKENNFEAVKKDARARIIKDHPEASAEEVEERLSKVLARGSQPTSATILPKPPFKPPVSPDRLFRLKKRR